MLLTAAALCSFNACAFDWQGMFSSKENASISQSGTLCAVVEQTTENSVVIKVQNAKEKQTLMDVMTALQTQGALSFTVEGGMMTAINGKKNATDWSYCWMLYTSDSELANSEGGTYEYGGQLLGIAVVGVESLPVMSGCVYVWYYQNF